MHLRVDLLRVNVFSALCASWAWILFPSPRIGKVSAIISSIKFFAPFSLAPPSGNPSQNENVTVFALSQISYISPFLNFFLFLLLPFSLVAFHYPVFQMADPFFCILSLLLVPSSVFFISVIVFLSFYWFIFISCISLLEISMNLSTVYSSPVSTFVTVTLNSL